MIGPALSPESKRRARWIAVWAFLKAAEALAGHLASLAKAKAGSPEALPPPPPEDAR